MKPPSFSYHDPTGLGEALALLSQYGDESKVLAGGQSLVPLLNFRLAAPEHVIDINGLGELAYLRRTGGTLKIGALTRHASLERSDLAARHWPLLREAVRWVAHPQIRNRGTVGGSVAHADPAAEIPVALVALDARFTARSQRGTRTIGWRDFFSSALTTALEPDELLVEVEVPEVAPGSGYALAEYSRRHGDFALGGAAVLVTLDGSGACCGAAIALLGAAPTPVRAELAEKLLMGEKITEHVAAAAAHAAVDAVSPSGDIHGSSEYRTSLIEVLVRRAILTAAARAQGEDDGKA
ncbi:xanthine dehydrogenase family protein subunit M [Amycolatopsis rubida]|uniref:Xanthine dehydrogenase family protein subunit M n=1 Tax=Amycolatopsis rubida TaxID=112413 RepID=A0ABX0C024_9PSEU|nr:xanthine dehydrogenase family protein subunit M [Amycolatopsis sp. M39]MYW96198.1 xanthine dehydrogenase family protein subunit M [Amycolatopsis rubida]NEC61189.1 xanthine dehydrogenase family protein subunit M [Amycolatopsis rubida]OAP24285.1 6-hydroxypseudooxynicotine dehydrogenase complex subunit alpha [Amycolatopsis sp. M39]